ncbi:DUF2256 and DUF3253 domain-containing protein [bacterium]|nr:DUF2256 and DUF3253 domain-containing protein [bacterium]
MKPDKVCQTCGRTIQWRKKWENSWDEVKYCSSRCRSSKPNRDDKELERVILKLLQERAHGATICPSEASRLHFGEAHWKPNMEKTRQAARRLVDQGLIEILQKGRVVDPSTAKGPIRLRLRLR